MALAFSKAKGTAQKSVTTYKMVDKANSLRMVGGLLARYVYWVPGGKGKDIPIECLAFNRDTEKFDQKEVDHVQDYFPEKTCSWNYAINCIDPTDGTVKAFNLKKKLYMQIEELAEDLGDPTDPDTGWSIHFVKSSTGGNTWDVAYTLSQRKCEASALTDEEKALVAAAPSIDESYPRQTSAEIKTLLDRITKINDEDEDSGETSTKAEKEAIDELASSGDVPQ